MSAGFFFSDTSRHDLLTLGAPPRYQYGVLDFASLNGQDLLGCLELISAVPPSYCLDVQENAIIKGCLTAVMDMSPDDWEIERARSYVVTLLRSSLRRVHMVESEFLSKLCEWLGPTLCASVVDSFAGIAPWFKFSIQAMVIIMAHAGKLPSDFIEHEVASAALTETQYNRYFCGGLEGVASQIGIVSRSLQGQRYSKANPNRRAKLRNMHKTEVGKNTSSKIWDISKMSFHTANFEPSLEEYTLTEQLDFQYFTESLATDLMASCDDFNLEYVGNPPPDLLVRISEFCREKNGGKIQNGASQVVDHG